MDSCMAGLISDRCSIFPASAEACNDGGEIYGLYRFGDVVLKPGGQHSHLVLGAAVGGEGNCWDPPAVLGRQDPHLADQVITVFPRHTDVGDKHIGQSLRSSHPTQFGKTLRSRSRHRHLRAVAFKYRLDELAGVRLIIHHQHPKAFKRRRRLGYQRHGWDPFGLLR
jgi:hypothetical protein